MSSQCRAWILGAAVLVNLWAASVVSAQEGKRSAGATDSAGEPGGVEWSSQPAEPPKSKPRATSHDEPFTGTAQRFLGDQQEIWASPAKLRLGDAGWLLPLAGVGAALLVTDTSFRRSQSDSFATMQRYKTISTAGVAGLGGAAGGMWLMSFHSNHAHWRETGLLAGEAALNSLLMVETLKYSLGRARPYQGTGNGPFFQSGGTSFPSEHAAAAWSIAGVIAHEYPGPLTKIAAYGIASLVSVSRVRAGQHFPSDVLVGSVAGYMIAQSIYSRHARPDLPGTEWRSFREQVQGENDAASGRVSVEDTPLENMGSPYVPLDSWVYPAIERLEALGYLHSAFEGAKPWARTECARLIAEASDELGSTPTEESSAGRQAEALLSALAREFRAERELEAGGPKSAAFLRSAYTRVISSNGPVLTDGYHFGQTYAYDYGRPFRRGTNFISGLVGDFTAGRVFLHLSGEFQHAPGAPALSDPVREVIAERDLVPVSPAEPFGAINQVAVLDSYLGFNLDNLQISFGRQSLSWGPGPGGSLILSDNAAPFYMLRVSQARPVELPWFLGVLGPMRLESFMGREQGHPISGHPFIYGQKVSVKPWRSLEFAYSRTTTIGGIGDTLNTGTFFESMLGRVNPGEGSVPGDSHTSVDWTWHLPHAGDRLVFYGEMESDDDPIPLQNLTKAVLRPGIYLVRLPGLDKWDLHAEWTTSVSPGERGDHGSLNYWNTHYRDGYTNNGNLVGNTVGREGKTIQVWTRCWISPHQTLDLTAKNSEVDTDFIPGGGKWQDYRATHEAGLRSGVYFRSFLQFEHIASFPLLFAGAKNNVSASLEIGFAPGLRH